MNSLPAWQRQEPLEVLEAQIAAGMTPDAFFAGGNENAESAKWVIDGKEVLARKTAVDEI